MRVRLWIRQDGEQPKAVAIDATKAPGPGRLVDVEAKNPDEARRVFALSRAPEPDEQQDGERWLAWRSARRLVTHLDGQAPAASVRERVVVLDAKKTGGDA